MNTKLTDLRDRIQRHHGVATASELLELLDDLAAQVQRIEAQLARTEAQLQRTANVASCLANGIQPD